MSRMRTRRPKSRKAFSGWSGGQDYMRPAKPRASPAASEITVPLADKPSVTVILGQATGLRYKDPDALALRVGTAIFGSGFTGRLMGTVRDKEGLTYNIGASVGEDSIVDGAWDIDASFAPALLAKGVASTRRELEKWWKDGVTDQELAARKQGMIGSYFVGLSTTGGLAGTILSNTQRGYDLSWLDGYPAAVKAMTRGAGQYAPSKLISIQAPWCWLRPAASRPPAAQRTRLAAAQIVLLADLQTRLPQDVVRGGHMEEHIGQQVTQTGRACLACSWKMTVSAR